MVIKTSASGTLTSEGFINHLRHPAGFFMPVKLDIKPTLYVYELKAPLPPLRDLNGDLLFAMPGGKTFVHKGTRCSCCGYLISETTVTIVSAQ